MRRLVRASPPEAISRIRFILCDDMTHIIGHEHVLEMLSRTAMKDRPAHSYMFTGIEGIGKKMTGVRFAGLLNCEAPRQDTLGECSTCRRIETGNHPDFYILSSDRSSIRIEQVRQLQAYFKFPPLEGRWRIALIDDAHLMTRAAQNALLKTMEEPPTGRMIILVTSKPHLLLPTVRSRCRRIRFSPLLPKDVALILQREKKLSEEMSLILASLSGGSVSESLRLITKSFTELRIQILNAITHWDALGWCDILDLSAKISRDQETARETIKILGCWLRDLIYVKSLQDGSMVTNRDFIDILRSMRDGVALSQIFRCYNELVRALELLESDYNVNRFLVTDVMLTRVARILDNQHTLSALQNQAH